MNSSHIEEAAFLKFHSNYFGEVVDSIKQIAQCNFSGEELLEYLQAFALSLSSEAEPKKELTSEWLELKGYKFTIDGFWKITDEILMSSDAPYALYVENNDNSLAWFAGGIETVVHFTVLIDAINGKVPSPVNPSEDYSKLKEAFEWGLTYGINAQYDVQHPKFTHLANESWKEYCKKAGLTDNK